MSNPQIHITNPVTGEDGFREMTDEEYAELVATGWPLEGTDETPIAD